MSRFAPILILLTACGQRLWEVEANISFDNATGYDFVEAEVCGYTNDETICTEPGGVNDGDGFDQTIVYLVFNGEEIEFDAWALDVDNDEYEQTFLPQIIVDDTVIDVDVNMTLDDLQ